MTESLDRRAALLAIVPALLSIAIIAHHPVVRVAHPADVAELVAGIDRVAGQSAAFHALILLLLSIQTLGLFAFAERLDRGTTLVRGGALLLLVSLMLIVGAGTIDGFVTPLLAQRCAIEDCRSSFTFAFAAIQGFTRVGLGAQAIALACWSIALVLQVPRLRIAGAIGLCLSLGALVVLIPLGIVIDPSRLGTIMLFEMAWSVGAGVLLWRGRLPGSTPTDASSASARSA